MKKVIRTICLLCAALLLFASCAKNGARPESTPAALSKTPAETAASAAGKESEKEQMPQTSETPAAPSEETAPVTVDLMADIRACAPQEKQVDETFAASQMTFDLTLFKALAEKCRDKEKSLLVSPLSVMLALAMTANGAEGQTKAEMEALLGSGIALEDLNAYLCSYLSSLPSSEKCKFSFADSIWLRNRDLTVKESFLQTNADYYGAGAYAVPFDAGTVKDINDWVSEHTDGMIKEIVKEFSRETALVLINALCFDAEWANKYSEYDLDESVFYAANGVEQTATMMSSTESIYISDEHAEGFIRPYAGGRYSFAALLPDVDTNIYDYAASLTPEGLYETLKNARSGGVSAKIPKFSCKNEWSLENVLPQLGIPTAFSDGADFSGISETNALTIGKVTHKTFIDVTENGTRAGAATAVEMNDGIVLTTHFVFLDRPFVYMIIDNETNLPVFMGILASLY